MKRVLVTGTSSGIGAATARHLHDQGMTVFAGVRNGHEAPGAELPRMHRIALDITDEASIAAAVATLTGELAGHGLDAVINNAGIAVPGPLETLPIADLRTQLETNVLGQVALTQAVLPLLRPAGGRIVFVGSVGGRVAGQFAGPYHASKFAMEAVADAWRQELDPEDLPVVLVEPGPISTPIWDRAIERLDAQIADPDPRLERYRERLVAFRSTLRDADRHGSAAEDVAAAIEKALEADHPKARYLVGVGARVVALLNSVIPDRLADKLAERTARA